MTAPDRTRSVAIPIGRAIHEGLLGVPEQATGIVLFSHGSGSGHRSPRNNFVAATLRKHGLATLLFDLLTGQEDGIYENRFNIDLLTQRLIAVTEWVHQQPATRDRTIGYFGASTGAASALRAAAALGTAIGAVVSRGGRPDLALDDLPRVAAPTLLIVGGRDDGVIELNRAAYRALQARKELLIVPGATHLFEEPGTLEQVADAAAAWFVHNL